MAEPGKSGEADGGVNGAELARLALEVAEAAGALVLRGFRQPLSIQYKAHQEPFTEHDLASERLIRRRLAEATPDLPIVGEEQGGEAGSGLTWYCDPIDGTINFMRGQPFFAVSLGLARGQTPVAGAVVAPALGLRWHGSPASEGGLGAFRNGVRCSVSATTELAQAVVSAGLPLKRGPVDDSYRWLRGLSSASRDLRRGGSAALDLCLVADGSYDLYVSRKLSPWDTCAGAAIAAAAGAEWRSGAGPAGRLDLCGQPGLLEAAERALAAA